MLARAAIIARHANHRWGRIKCHWDGQPLLAGATLLQAYTDQAKIEDLIALGDLSSLGSLVSAPAGVRHTFKKPAPDVCVSFSRDRGETWATSVFYDALGEALDDVSDETEHVYVWDGEEWFYLNDYDTTRQLEELTPELCGF